MREGRFKNRSKAIRTIIALYEEREKTREFYEMLTKRSREAKEKPEILVSLFRKTKWCLGSHSTRGKKALAKLG